jgi:hypothetical protein
MSRRQSQIDFLKALVLHADGAERQLLIARMARAERDEHCTRSALILMLILSFVSLCSVCYSMVLVPDLLRNPSPAIIRWSCLLGLASSICSVVFFFCWLWYRGVLTRAQGETRRFILCLLDTQCSSRANRMQLVALGQTETTSESSGTPLVTGPKHPSYWELFRLKGAS